MDTKKDHRNARSIADAFIAYLKKEKKEKLLPEIVRALSRTVTGELTSGEVVSSVPLPTETLKELETKLSNKFNKTVELANTVDPSLLGGLVIRFGDVVIDESVRTQLATLKETIYGS